MRANQQPFETVERNLRHAMAFYSRARPTGEVRDMPGLRAISCGWNYPVFNSALLTSPVPDENGGMGSRLAMASVYYRALGMGWSYWACHDLLDVSTLRHLTDICHTYRMAPVLTAPGMLTESFRPPLRAAIPIEIRPVEDDATRLAFAHLVSVIFDLPFQMTLHMYGHESAWTPEYGAFIGYDEGRPVTIAMVNVAEECCGFYSVGTVPGYRRRGYAETLMREAARQTRSRLQFDTCVLQSSTAGRRLYEQMGFREVTRFSVFRSSPE